MFGESLTLYHITYVIGTYGTASAIKIESKKKALLNTVTVDGKTYPVVAIVDNACKNNKNATIKIKGVKGNTKEKLQKAVKK